MTAPPLSSRILLGAIAGFVGTAAMTAAMWRAHRLLPPSQRYPLPPREITETLLPLRSDEVVKDLTTAAHFAYGAASGALMATAKSADNPLRGALAGSAIWVASYFGWIPLAGILRPAHHHPARRNMLMIGTHLVWGAATSATLRELLRARQTMLRPGPLRDRV